MKNEIGIFSLEADLHAHAIKHELAKLGVKAYFFATDSQINDGGIIWDTSRKNACALREYDGQLVNISDLAVIWWRRVNQPQKDQHQHEDSVSFELISNEWKSAIFGAVADSFSGAWVNDPKYDALAGNKIYHLRIAKETGLDVPDTLVTNNCNEAARFCEKHNNEVIIKKIIGGANLSLATLEISAETLLQNDSSVAVCPIMLQKKIKAQSHIRATCFGDKVVSVEIFSDEMDWRRDLNGDFREYNLPLEIEKKLTILLNKLGLRMGVMDLIVSDEGITWLEINPQGQFLFAEGLSGVDIKTPFASYLRDLALDMSANSDQGEIIMCAG